VFCESWLAKDKDASYIRVLKFHNKDPSADALATCASKLGYYVMQLSASDKTEHQDWVERFVRLQRLCHQAIDQQARKRWMTPQRMRA
jgi:2-succinyl-5-enolpyruvyl-6-hydroxy-3-cyclohexene-1-carboxylate synthase